MGRHLRWSVTAAQRDYGNISSNARDHLESETVPIAPQKLKPWSIKLTKYTYARVQKTVKPRWAQTNHTIQSSSLFTSNALSVVKRIILSVDSTESQIPPKHIWQIGSKPKGDDRRLNSKVTETPHSNPKTYGKAIEMKCDVGKQRET